MTELTSVKGIGQKTAEALSRLGISDMEDLLGFYPRDYETFSAPKQLWQLEAGKLETAQGVLVKDASMNYFNGMRIVNAYLSDMTGRLQLSWYNLPYIKNSLHTGVSYVFRGRVYEKNGRKIMYQPRVYAAEEYAGKYEGRLLPVYPLTKGVSSTLLRKAVFEALRTKPLRKDYLPEELRTRQGLAELNFAMEKIHFPENRETLLLARARLCFDEFFFFLLSAARLRKGREALVSAYRCRPDVRILSFIADLPFELTAAQQKAWREISADLSSGKVMNRLLEGDVGSGKTIVALLAMLLAALNGYQSVLMAPTEVLASQHYETVNALLNRSGLPLSAVLVTGSMTASQRRSAYARIEAHEADLIIGTHAVFQEKLVYDRLGLVVTDEQHRFGVAQRELLSQKGGEPHVLVMSATPIPRTLAIILYGELDISVLDRRPSGRQEIKNCVVGPSYRKTAYKFILDEVKKGRQAYIICPMIEKETQKDEASADGVYESLGNTAELENVKDYAKKLTSVFPPEITVSVLHGRMKAQKKEAVMTAFKEGRIQVLVSTTVVEVGVDVPNATVMMIENAERFGLAQLHQLRGRVGRGAHQSYCIMLNTSEGETAKKRLDILAASNDGFYIAGEDLKLRGPGDIFGIRQSGDLSFGLADIYNDAAILKKAKMEADRLLSSDPELLMEEHRALSEELGRRMSSAQSIL
ncbi:MAG: ATP-dependent DNA helicase RecG [Eubacteriales bacterium]|nr:ATP-dependent DNA helicase RecG [Eubacteriales bacterium]